jgi:transposase InsO family protein
MKNPLGQQIEAQLPSDRVKTSKPFAVTDTGFAGPLYMKLGSDMNKAYITLFKCTTSRAVHLELCTDMSTDKILMALQRFVGRRGVSCTIYTDNTRTFHATNVELSALWKQITASKTHQFIAHNGIQWIFIAPLALGGEDGGRGW